MPDDRLELEFSVDDKGGLAALNEIGTRIQTAKKRASEFGDELDGGKFGSGLRASAGRISEIAIGIGVARVAMDGLRSAFAFASESVIGMNSSLETATLQFETLFGSAERAGVHVRSLFEFAAKTPFATEPIIEASRLMQTFGGDSLNTQANLTLVGDAAAATSTPIEEVGFWVGRLDTQLQSANGKFGESATRLQEMGILSGTARERMEALQTAGASADEVFAAFQEELGTFSGSMGRLQGTWEGLTSSLADNAGLLLADTFNPIFEAIKGGMQALIDILNSGQLQAAMAELGLAVAALFGDTAQQQAATMRETVIGFVTSVIDGATFIRRAWAVIETLFNGLQVVFELLVLAAGKFIEVFARISNAMPGFRGDFDDVVSVLGEFNTQTLAAARAQEEQLEAAVNVALGNDDLGVSLSNLSTEFANAQTNTDAVTTAFVAGTDAVTGNQGLKTALKAVETGTQDVVKELEPLPGIQTEVNEHYVSMNEKIATLVTTQKGLTVEVLESSGRFIQLSEDLNDDVIPAVEGTTVKVGEGTTELGNWESAAGVITDTALPDMITALGGNSTAWGSWGTSIRGVIKQVGDAAGALLGLLRLITGVSFGGTASAINQATNAIGIGNVITAGAPPPTTGGVGADDVAGVGAGTAGGFLSPAAGAAVTGIGLVIALPALVGAIFPKGPGGSAPGQPSPISVPEVEGFDPAFPEVTGEEGFGFHQGGLVRGRAGRDRLHARLTAGEGVLNQAAVRRIGPGGLDALNRGGGVGGVTVAIDMRGSVVTSERDMDRLARDVGDRLVGRLQRRRRVNVGIS